MRKQPPTTIKFHGQLYRRAAAATGRVSNIETETTSNRDYRRVLYTGKHTQLVLMSLPPGAEIGSEVHEDTDQFFRIEAGEGEVEINGQKSAVRDGTAVVVPAGARHNVRNTGRAPLQLYTLYSPPHHRDGLVVTTKADEVEESFDGTTTE
jgi:mannose-6-phosphate isomerase-like protein (cupin superfamily)